MNKKVGLWINRKKAVIVSIADDVEARRIITSDMEHHVLYSSVVPGDGAPDEIRDRRFWNHLGEYYDKIVEHIRDATEILIFGPEVWPNMNSKNTWRVRGWREISSAWRMPAR
jgi:hypothetical protein